MSLIDCLDYSICSDHTLPSTISKAWWTFVCGVCVCVCARQNNAREENTHQGIQPTRTEEKEENQAMYGRPILFSHHMTRRKYDKSMKKTWHGWLMASIHPPILNGVGNPAAVALTLVFEGHFLVYFFFFASPLCIYK